MAIVQGGFSTLHIPAIEGERTPPLLQSFAEKGDSYT